MAGLINYTCDKCGGILNIDCDQENLGCPFCGRQIDYAEYHRQDSGNGQRMGDQKSAGSKR